VTYYENRFKTDITMTNYEMDQATISWRKMTTWI